MKQIRQLENCLEDEMGISKIINYFKSTGHEIPEQDVDVSRRSFLKGGAALGATLAVGSLGFSNPVKAKTREVFWEIKKFGPAFYKQQGVLRTQYDGLSRRHGYDRSEQLGQLFNHETGHKVFDNNVARANILDSNVPYYEPFYHFFSNSMRSNFTIPGDHVDFKKLARVNPALDYFDSSITGFRLNWIDPEINHEIEKHVEGNGLKSICVAAFGKQKGEQFAKNMLNSNINGKKIYAKKIIEEFSRKSGYNSGSKEPQNPFNQALVANWAAYILNNHFQNLLEGNNPPRRNPVFDSSSKYFEEVDFYENHLLKPLEQFSYRVQPVNGEYYYLMKTFVVEKNNLGTKVLLGHGGPNRGAF